MPALAVGAAGTPVNVGPARSALVAISAAISAFTNAVVASWVVFVPWAAVGAKGIPVKFGLASGAFALRSLVDGMPERATSTSVP